MPDPLVVRPVQSSPMPQPDWTASSVIVSQLISSSLYINHNGNTSTLFRTRLYRTPTSDNADPFLLRHPMRPARRNFGSGHQRSRRRFPISVSIDSTFSNPVAFTPLQTSLSDHDQSMPSLLSGLSVGSQHRQCESGVASAPARVTSRGQLASLEHSAPLRSHTLATPARHHA